VNAVRAIYGSDRYAYLEDEQGFVKVDLPSARYHDCIHDVPGNPYYDPQDLYKIKSLGGGRFNISCYIYNWGENLDLKIYSDPSLTNLVAQSTIVNTPYTNIESIDFEAQAAATYYLKVYSPEPGNSSLYDLTIDYQPIFDIVGTDLAPSALPLGGHKVPFLKLECTSSDSVVLDELIVYKFGTLRMENVGGIQLYDDTVPNGVLDDGDALIASSLSPKWNRVKFSSLDLEVTEAQPRVLFVTADVSAGSVPGTFGLSLESYKDATTQEGYQAPYTSFPIASSLSLVGE